MENKTYKVPAENVDLLKSQVDVINKRVTRLVKKGHDVKPIVLDIGPMFIETKRVCINHFTDEYKSVEQVYCNVTLVSPEPPVVKGWTFVAALTHVEDIGTVLRVVPGAQVEEGELKQFRTASPDNCDHCHCKRKRNDTFILRHE